ncbi:ribonuclease H-like domain-containing protein [Lasiosphaeris hirsuta]|uniref:Ribonuclease H-like domain-containing protein n=1 Tax=Lasiosphaeris hirsuta TaxID=260670 RepID=A0AA40DNZ9_9PEZI|nr:ribonuclease H-like domain-containing protein [Lasiosphaeris hirsuta]
MAPIIASPDAFAQSTEYAEVLNRLTHTIPELRQAGYVVQSLSYLDLERKKRCDNCNTRCTRDTTQPLSKANSIPSPGTKYSDRQLQPQPRKDSEKEKTPAEETLRCKFHPGKYVKKKWTCCGNPGSAKPCGGATEHKARIYGPRELEGRWQFHQTPGLSTQPERCAAVAIDCEMGTAFDGESELIRLSMVDYFSGAILIDKLVFPSVKIQHYNTRWSGVTALQMDKAYRRGQCIMGMGAARREVLEFVGPGTIVVGHGAQNDFSSLRWIHHRVIDSYLIENAIAKKEAQAEADELAAKLATATGPESSTSAESIKAPPAQQKAGMSLKALIKRRCGRDIQTKGKNGHDSLEDAVAARDLVHFHVMALLEDAVTM